MKKIYVFLTIGIIALVLFRSHVANAASFSDVSQDHPNDDAIAYVKANSIVSGYPDGSFKPGNAINRAEFTKIIIGAQFHPTVIDSCVVENIQTGSSTVFFPDVPKQEWFAKYICVAKKYNVIKGYPDDTFKPGNHINFAEAAKVISNAFAYPVSEDTVWYKPFVEKLGERNAIPITITRFDANINRGEMAEMIYRLKANVATKESLSYETIWQMDPLSRTTTLQVAFTTLADNENLLDCGKTSMVTRTLPYTTAPARVALEQLFLGPTAEEKTGGMLDYWITRETEHNLKRVFIKNGVAYLDWKDITQVIPNAGTSCGSASFLSPIEATLKQFPTITKVIHAINGQTSLFYGFIQMGCSAENNNCDDTPYGTTSLPSTTCQDEIEGMPVIASISVTSGVVGTKLEVNGCNFSGFEGDRGV